MTTPKLEQRHFDALEYATRVFRSHAVICVGDARDSAERQAAFLAELPAILRAMEERIVELEGEQNDWQYLSDVECADALRFAWRREPTLFEITALQKFIRPAAPPQAPAVPDGYKTVKAAGPGVITNEMKWACIGEFSWKEEAPYYDENGKLHEDYVAQHVVPWDICKQIYKAMLAIAPAAAPAPQPAAVPDARCPYCDGTGDVHSIDGEWRGSCDCEAPHLYTSSPDHGEGL